MMYSKERQFAIKKDRFMRRRHSCSFSLCSAAPAHITGRVMQYAPLNQLECIAAHI
jgi:hypothetical protein